MIYAYVCSCGESIDRDFAVGLAPSKVPCTCGVMAPRDFGAAQIRPSNDPFRAYHISGKKERVQAEQQRRVEGPQDSFEKKHWEAATGRKYIGDDISGMTAKAQKAIQHGRSKRT